MVLHSYVKLSALYISDIKLKTLKTDNGQSFIFIFPQV